MGCLSGGEVVVPVVSSSPLTACGRHSRRITHHELNVTARDEEGAQSARFSFGSVNSWVIVWMLISVSNPDNVAMVDARLLLIDECAVVD